MNASSVIGFLQVRISWYSAIGQEHGWRQAATGLGPITARALTAPASAQIVTRVIYETGFLMYKVVDEVHLISAFPFPFSSLTSRFQDHLPPLHYTDYLHHNSQWQHSGLLQQTGLLAGSMFWQLMCHEVCPFAVQLAPTLHILIPLHTIAMPFQISGIPKQGPPHLTIILKPIS
jgi:hypothetical protein